MFSKKQRFVGMTLSVLIIAGNLLGGSIAFAGSNQIDPSKANNTGVVKGIGGRLLHLDLDNYDNIEDAINGENYKYGIVEDGNAYGYNIKTSKNELVDLSLYKDKLEGKLVLPLDEKYFENALKSGFGIRKHPISQSLNEGVNIGRFPFHSGLDIAAANIKGSNVYSVLDGTVKELKLGHNGGYGNFVAIDHGEFETYYLHLESINAKLEVGDQVEAGDIIGLVGSTGNSTGPHLHVEFRFGDIAVNPSIFLSGEFQNSMDNLELEEREEVKNVTEDEIEDMTEDEIKDLENELGMEILDESYTIELENIVSSGEIVVDTGIKTENDKNKDNNKTNINLKDFKIIPLDKGSNKENTNQTNKTENNIQSNIPNKGKNTDWKIIPIE